MAKEHSTTNAKIYSLDVTGNDQISLISDDSGAGTWQIQST